MSQTQQPTPPPSPAHSSQKWTEIELLPAWDEEYYDVYTAKKHGKWVMLKTLKPAYKHDPRFEAMIEKEFDVRYNLAHPNIVMINDYEEVPGLGMCIITDDVYGDSLRKLISEHKVTTHHLDQVCHNLVDAIDYIQRNHVVHFPIRPETVVFTENIGNLKLIDVGFDQREKLSPTDAADDIYSFGVVLKELLTEVPDAPAHLRKVAERCCAPVRQRYGSVHQLRMALAHRSNINFYLIIIGFLIVLVGALLWFSSRIAAN